MRSVFCLISFVTIISSCGLLTQNDFIERRSLLITKEEYVFYDVIQTGLDNYTFSFRSAYNGDTATIFEYYLNDAVYTAMHLETKLSGDTIYIKTKMPSDDEIHRLHRGRTFKFSGTK